MMTWVMGWFIIALMSAGRPCDRQEHSLLINLWASGPACQTARDVRPAAGLDD
jgi:hypothetical protein